jgi:hypothetical protein
MVHESDNEYDNNNLDHPNSGRDNQQHYQYDNRGGSFSDEEEQEESEDEFATSLFNQAREQLSKVTSWLTNQRLLETLLSPDYLHLQLLKRCKFIPPFLSRNDR